MKRNHARIANTQGKWMRGGLVAVAVLGASLLGFSCDGKDAEGCRGAQAGVRASLQAGDTALLARWRDRAFKLCEDSEFSALDREILDTQAQKQKAEAEKQQKLAENKAVLDLFSAGWASSGPRPRAPPPPSPVTVARRRRPRRSGGCVRQRQAGPYTVSVRYWEKESAAASFHVVVPNPITCEALGPSQVLRTWTVQGSIKRYHCQITGGPAAGMQAMVTEAMKAPLHVFSPQFVERDPALKAKLTSEGL
jgi:hypothetical protein